jgi:hypothetical protein
MRQIEMRLFGRHMDFPVSYPHDGGVRDRSSGDAISRMYKNFGLRMMHEHATHTNVKGVAATSLEAGIQEINAREQHGNQQRERHQRRPRSGEGSSRACPRLDPAGQEQDQNDQQNQTHGNPFLKTLKC